MKFITHLLSSALKCALLAFALLPSTDLQAQWQPYTPVISDTVGTYDLRIAQGNNQIAWSIAMKYDATPVSYDPFYIDSIYYLKTADGGNTWSGGTIPMGPGPYASNICPVSNNTAWASGIDSNFASYVLRTTDGGATWTRQLEEGFTSATSYIDFVHFWDDQNGIAVGDPAASDTHPDPFYEIYRTSDGGQNWSRVSSDDVPATPPNEYGVGGDYFVTGNHVWFPTFDATVNVWTRLLHSADRGATWTTTFAQTGNLSFADSLHAIGTVFNPPNYVIRYTDDGWVTWTNLPAITGGDLTSIVLIPESYYILAVMRNSIVSGPFRNMLSKDLGQSWTEIGNGAELIDNLQFASPGIGYAGEWQSLEHPTRMYKYAGDPLVGLFSGLELDAQVTLSPNPASDLLQVQIEVAEPAAFVLLLNDMQGQLIERKVLEKTALGNAQFNISQLPAGMYTLTVSSEKGHLTRPVSKQ